MVHQTFLWVKSTLLRRFIRRCVMESKDLYRHLLGMNEPWRVESVTLDMAKRHVDVQTCSGRVVYVPGMRPDVGGV